MRPLADEKFWNDKYRRQDAIDDSTPTSRPRKASRVKSAVKSMLGDTLVRYSRSAAARLYDQHLGGRRGQRVIEIGSAPGSHLVDVHRTYGLVPYGAEYTDSGVALNRKVFESAGLDPSHVIHADFFDETFHDAWDGQFDVVLSRGFIEHFDVLHDVIDKHVSLLKPGGVLLVWIPNFRGRANYIAQSLLHRELLDMHNLDIMQLAPFRGLFDRADLVERYCDYFGAFSWTLFETEYPTGLRARLHSLAVRLELPYNMLMHLLYGDGSFRHPDLSSHLCYVGEKIAL